MKLLHLKYSDLGINNSFYHIHVIIFTEYLNVKFTINFTHLPLIFVDFTTILKEIDTPIHKI